MIQKCTLQQPTTMSDHNHSHSGGCCHSNDDHADPNNLGLLYSLYSKIDLDNLTTLNESEENSGRTVFRSWDERLSKEQVCCRSIKCELDESILILSNLWYHIRSMSHTMIWVILWYESYYDMSHTIIWVISYMTQTNDSDFEFTSFCWYITHRWLKNSVFFL